MTDITLALITGADIPIPECQLIIHQPTIKEISQLGETEFFQGIQFLCIPAQENFTSFQIFCQVMKDKQLIKKKEIILDTLLLFFPSYKIQSTPRALLFNNNEESIIIDENNFSFLQEVVKRITCLTVNKQEAFNPANEAAAKIARKLEEGRRRVAAQKQSGEDNSNKSVFSQYLSILSVNFHKTLKEVSELTVFQVYDLIERYALFESYDLDIRSRLAGAKPDEQPEDWRKNIH